MNGFVVTANPPAKTEEPVVTNDGWFPDMDPAKVRDACRLDGTVTTPRLRPALVQPHFAAADDSVNMGFGHALELAHQEIVEPLPGRVFIHHHRGHLRGFA